VRPWTALILTGAATVAAITATPVAGCAQPASATIKLPEVRHQGATSLDAALWARQSTRTFTRDTVALADLGQLLWAAEGVNRPNRHRTAPSAMATYPLELYVVASRVHDLPPGVYHYLPVGHEIERLAAGDRLADVVGAARSTWIADAAAVVVFAGAFDRASGRLGDRADRYIAIEAGAAAQNLGLEAAALGLGATFVGSAQDSAVSRLVGLPPGQRPMGIMPVGRPR
jgi:SagB-type dehydrogenase family enzyme